MDGSSRIKMFNLEDFNALTQKRKKAVEKLRKKKIKLANVEFTQTIILFWGSFLITIAAGVAAIFSYPGFSKFGGFICGLLIFLISAFFMLFQLIMNDKVDKARRTYQKALRKEEDLREESFAYTGICFA